jgi:hypothetical protein
MEDVDKDETIPQKSMNGHSLVDYEREQVCRLAQEHCEFVTDIDGFVYWNPCNTSYWSSYQL